MNKKGFICSLVLSVLVTLSLGIYTLVSIFYVPTSQVPEKPYEPKNESVQVAFRNNENVSCLDTFSVEDGTLKFVFAEEGQENPLAFDEESGKYVTKNIKGSVKAIVTINEKGDTITYEISVYPHSDAGLTEDAPFIIASEEHLWEFAAIMNDTSSDMRTEEKGNLLKFAELVSDIHLTYNSERKNWIPMGNLGKFVEYLTFKGNGYTIYNLKINVDGNNYTNCLTSIGDENNSTGSMNLGFFGCVFQSKIYDLNFSGAAINVSSDVYQKAVVDHDWSVNGNFNIINVGVVAARVSGGTLIEGSENKSSVSAKIEGFSYVNDTTTYKFGSGLGGVVGLAIHSQIKNYKVDLDVVNNISKIKYSNIGGIAGCMHAATSDKNILDTDGQPKQYYKNTISNCDVNLNVETIYDNVSKIAGVVATAYNADINDCNVESIVVKDKTDYKNIVFTKSVNEITKVNGVVNIIQSLMLSETVTTDAEVAQKFYSNVNNVKVNNFDFKVEGAQANGFGSFISSETATTIVKITDVSVHGSAYAREAFGFARQIYKNAIISYTKDFTGVAVDANLTGMVAAGFGEYVYGTITGYKDESGVKTTVNVNITGLGARLTQDQVNNYALRKSAYDNTHISGLASWLYSNNDEDKANISNFMLNVKLVNGLNMAGVVYENNSGAIADLDVNADIYSYNYNEQGYNYSTTYMVGGVACLAGTGSSIENVNIVLNVNKGVDKNLKYGASFFGGIVARVQEDEVIIKNNSVTGDVYFNDTYYTAVIKNSDETNTYYRVFVAGGIVGSFTSYVETTTNENIVADAFDKVVTENTQIVSNTINNLSLVFDDVYDKMERDGFRMRAIGVVIGNYYSDNDIDISSNTIEDANITADIETFTYGYKAAGGWTKIRTTLGYDSEEGKFEYSFGISSKQNATGGVITDVSSEQLAKAVLTELKLETAEA